MNIALVSVLTSSSDLHGEVGAISLTVNDRVNVWLVGINEFKAHIESVGKGQPLQTQARAEALDGLIKEGWPKVKLSTALDDINELIKEVQSPIVVWDFDPVSFIDAHAFLWTKHPECRPNIRRVEGDWGNFFLSSLACFKGLNQGFVEYNGFYTLNGRATKAHSLIYKWIGTVMPNDDWKAAPKLEMRDIKDRSSETLMAPLPPLNLGVPAAPAAQALNIPAPALKLPGM